MAIPTLTCGRNGTDSCIARHRADQRKPGADGPLGIVLVGLRIAEIDERSIAHILGDRAAKPGHSGDAGLLKRAEDVAHFLGIEPGRKCCRTDEIAEHDGQLSTFGIGGSWGRRRRRDGAWLGRGIAIGNGAGFGLEARDGVEQPTSMADQIDPDIPEVVGGQARQHLDVNRVVAKRRRILFEAQPAQPIGDIKRHRQRSLLQSVARRHQFGVGSCGPQTFDARIAGSSPIWK